MDLTEATVQSILTRTSGYLRPVASHSLQPYRGCGLGASLCGAGCYVQHSVWITHGRPWGSFVEARTNAAQVYQQQYETERRWARKAAGRFGIFLSSATEPFQPAERKYGVTRRVLEAMVDRPPDMLILQTHSHRVIDYADLIGALAGRCELRAHVSIETDLEGLPGLPPAASSVEKRLEACRRLKERRVRTVVTVAPLLPMGDPDGFFARIANVADAVVIDHFIGGDGSKSGSRTRRTRLPVAMQQVLPESVTIEYREQIVAIAQKHLPGRVGVGCEGFAGKRLAAMD